MHRGREFCWRGTIRLGRVVLPTTTDIPALLFFHPYIRTVQGRTGLESIRLSNTEWFQGPFSVTRTDGDLVDRRGHTHQPTTATGRVTETIGIVSGQATVSAILTRGGVVLVCILLLLHVTLTHTEGQFPIVEVMFLFRDVPQSEEIGRVDGTFDRDVVLEFGHGEPFEGIDVLDVEALKDCTDVRVEHCEVFPDLNREDQRTEKQAAPVDGVEGQVPEFCDPFDVDEGDDCVLCSEVLSEEKKGKGSESGSGLGAL